MPDPVSTGSSSQSPVQPTEKDVQFDCSHCANILVVDRDGAGLQLSCPFCGGPVVVPAESDPQYRNNKGGASNPQPSPEPAPPARQGPPPASQPTQPAATSALPRAPEPEKPTYTFDFSGIASDQLSQRLDELKRHIKENQSQRVELQGYINKATLELHRFQLKQKTLVERQHKFEAEYKALQSHIGSQPK